MKANNYIQPVVEVLTVNAAYSICAESTFENFGIINPTTPGQEIGADEGR